MIRMQCRAIRIIKLIQLPTFSTQLSFVLGDFNYLLAKQHVPSCAGLPVVGRGVSPLVSVWGRSGSSCGC